MRADGKEENSMKLVIEIPKEFERDWNGNQFQSGRFQDCFERVLADLRDTSCLSGNYEKEILEMLQSAFHDAKEYDKEHDQNEEIEK